LSESAQTGPFKPSLQLGPTNILGTGIGQQIQPFYLPGFMFIVICLLTYGLHRMSWKEIRESWGLAGRQTRGAMVALMFALPMARLFIESAANFIHTITLWRKRQMTINKDLGLS